MPVKRNVFVVVEILSKKINGGIPSYFVKIISSKGPAYRWLPSYEINPKKLDLFEAELKAHNSRSRRMRLDRRNLKKDESNRKSKKR